MPSPLTETASGIGVAVGVGEGMGERVAGTGFGPPEATQALRVKTRNRHKDASLCGSAGQVIAQDYTN